MNNAEVQLSTFPYLSLVAASRNDDHGGDPLIRTQIFINSFVRQCEKYSLPAEIIIVDWNPVPDRQSLSTVLEFPLGSTHVHGRVITVPSSLHFRLKYAERLALFQMIAKNVGIRRACGKFILATNIDIVFSDELIRFIAKQKLDPWKQYRVDRYDIKNGLSKDLSLDETLNYAWTNPIRTHRRYQPASLVRHLYGSELFKRTCIPDQEFRGTIDSVEVVQEDGVWQIRPARSVKMSHLHTNACGDFTLLSRDGWDAIRGYPEFAAYSFNIDSVGLIAAHYAGYQEVSLLPPCVCFHIEHGVGSGWTPEGEKQLFSRLREAGILNPEWPVLAPLVERMREEGRALEFNHPGWGMADMDLPEQPIGDPKSVADEELERLTLEAKTRTVSAIQPAYDLDRLTLAHERRLADDRELTESRLGSAVTTKQEKVVLYIPDTDGCYSEARSVSRYANLADRAMIVFRLEPFASQFPLRLDPCQCSGLVSIASIVIVDSRNNRLVWELGSRNSSKLVVTGTAVLVNGSTGRRAPMLLRFDRANGLPPFRMISTGGDPQLILPPLPADVGFPLIVTIEMQLVPCD